MPMYKQTETQFMQAVIAAAKAHQWKCAHFRSVRVQRKDGASYYATPVQADGEGFPDLVLAKYDRPIIFLEVKADTGVVSEQQAVWLAVLDRGSSPAFVVRPKDWDKLIKLLEGK